MPPPSATIVESGEVYRGSMVEEWRVELVSPPQGDGGSAGALGVEHRAPISTFASITVDGGSRGNPGPAACAAVVVEHGEVPGRREHDADTVELHTIQQEDKHACFET